LRICQVQSRHWEARGGAGSAIIELGQDAEAAVGREGGKRVHLQEVGSARRVESEVGACEVATLERRECAAGQRRQLDLQPGVEQAGDLAGPAAGRGRVALQGVQADAGRRLDRALQHGKHPGRIVPDQRHGVLGAGQERLHERGLAVVPDDTRHLARQRSVVLHPRGGPDALGRPLPSGFHE
jgi:hypothetical protein